MSPEILAWLLQVSDSQFPSGAYAHSLGLEELTQHGWVRNAADLERFLHHQVLPGLIAFELPLLRNAHQAAAEDNHNALRQIDDELDAWKLPAEWRHASRAMGSRRLALIGQLQSEDLTRTYTASGAPCHHLVACALELRHLPAEAMLTAFALQTVNGYAVSAMKLIRLGQERCQLLIRGALAELAPRLRDLASAPPTRLGWFNPLLEIASLRHARARERLFIS